MAVLVEEVPPALASYGEQCPCHSALLDCHKTEHAKKGMFALHYGDGHTICPLGGCMITLLVCGKLEESLDEAWAVSEDKLFTLPSLRGTKPMIDSEWGNLFGDFRLAKVAASNFVFLCLSPSGPRNHRMSKRKPDNIGRAIKPTQIDTI